MIKIFGIGNSFTEDAHTWLGEICNADGIRIKTVCPIIGGCTFKRHLDNIKSDSKEYELVLNGKRTEKKLSFMEALEMEDWDIITFNQGSTQAGRPFTYIPYLNQLIDIVKKHSPKAKLYIFQTWSYEIDSTHPYYHIYNNSQKEMWIRTKDCYKMAERISGLPIIPVGEIIQYLRENIEEFNYSEGGRSLNRDGFHLSEIYGRYTAGITFYKYLFSGNIKENAFLPSYNSQQSDAKIIEKIKDAVLEIANRPKEVEDE